MTYYEAEAFGCLANFSILQKKHRIMVNGTLLRIYHPKQNIKLAVICDIIHSWNGHLNLTALLTKR